MDALFALSILTPLSILLFPFKAIEEFPWALISTFLLNKILSPSVTLAFSSIIKDGQVLH